MGKIHKVISVGKKKKRKRERGSSLASCYTEDSSETRDDTFVHMAADRRDSARN